MKKGNIFPVVRLIVAALVTIVLAITTFWPGLINNLFDGQKTDYKSIVLNHYHFPDDEQSQEYYRGFYEGARFVLDYDNLYDFMKNTQTYDDILLEGFKMGYEEGINGAEY